MGNDVIQAQYDKLADISNRFGGQAEASKELISRVQQSMQPLQQGGWQGRGSAAFFGEMNGEVLPAMLRLVAALDQARSVTQEIARVVQHAEEEASRPFRSDGAAGPPLGVAAAIGVSAAGGAAAAGAAQGVGGLAGGGSVGAAGGSSGGTTGGGTASDASPAGGTGASQRPLDTGRIFSNSYMDDLVGLQVQGADSAQLNESMETLAGNPTPQQVDQALDQIAQARGLSREDVQAQYEHYQQLRAEAERIRIAKGMDPVPDVSQFFHDRFMGSTTQLRYGKVVGDALGLDPVFGAMLNPTGGLVGSGNAAVDLGDSALGYHGVMHDAAGYLYNYHNLGPGYNYLGLEDRDTSSPLTGQQAGIQYWTDKMNTGFIELTLSNTGGTLLGVAEDVKTGVSQAVDTVSDGARQVGDWFDNLFD